jgi:hypothetical protein
LLSADFGNGLATIEAITILRDGLARRGQKIDHIYHINLELLLGALYNHERTKDLKPLIQSARLRSVEDF